MPEYHVNELDDDDFPEEAAMGVLDDAVTIEAAADQLVSAGISAERLYFLKGEEAVTLLEESGGFFERFFESHVRDPALGALKEGEKVVLVYGVEEDDAEKVRSILTDSCVGETYYFGRWMFS